MFLLLFPFLISMCHVIVLLVNYDMDLTRRFLWKETQPVANELFPENQFGQYVLTRDRLVKKVKEAMNGRPQ